MAEFTADLARHLRSLVDDHHDLMGESLRIAIDNAADIAEEEGA